MSSLFSHLISPLAIPALFTALFWPHTAAAAENDDSALPSASRHALAILAPAHRWAVQWELRSNGWTKQYNNNGHREDMDVVFNQVDLNSTLFPVLTALGPGASLGTTAMNSQVDNQRSELTLGYGVTDNLTVGVIIPLTRTQSRIDLAVTGGNIGLNPAFDSTQVPSPSNFPFAPVGAGANQPLGTDGFQQVISSPALGYAYKPIATTHRTGLSDPTVGLLWRFYKRDKDSLVLGLGLRLGMGNGDDPDNLVDVPIGDNSTDLITQLEYFRSISKHFDLRLHASHKLQTKDRQTLRVPAVGQLLATAASKEKLKRNLGDYAEYDIEAGRSWGNWRSSLTWHRYDKQSDKYRSDIGTDTTALETNTRIYANQWRVALSWSGIQTWQDGHLPLPLIIKLEMQKTYQGRNFVDVSDVYLRLTSFF